LGAAVVMSVSCMSVGASAADWSLRYTTGATSSDNVTSQTLYTYYPSGTAVVRAKCNSLTSGAKITVKSSTDIYTTVTFSSATVSGKGKKLSFSSTPSAGSKITHKVSISASSSGGFYSKGKVYNSYA
ncbi:MAG: hypothetical protein LUE12_04540, partial [Ruminococcus sp.]|nr:hypothetical protein [Ruminococcus sp.]